jgi:hypothetical protein
MSKAPDVHERLAALGERIAALEVKVQRLEQAADRAFATRLAWGAAAVAVVAAVTGPLVTWLLLR